MNIKPCADRHAIKTAAFVIEWKSPLTSSELAKISSLHSKVSSRLPRKTEQKAPGFLLAMAGTQTRDDPSGGLVGVSFDVLQPNGEASWSLEAQPALILVSCRDYSRWETVWENVQLLLEAILVDDLANREIQALGLQYLDEFLIEANRNDLIANEVLRKESKFIPPHVFECRDLWHAYHGFFEDISDIRPYKRLDVINLDLMVSNDAEPKTLFQITMTHRALLNNPATFNELAGAQKHGVFSQIMDRMHNHNKMVMRDLLKDAICSRIGLGVTK